MNSEEAIKRFKDEYYKACSDDSIVDPVSYALYMTYLYSVYGRTNPLSSNEQQMLHNMETDARQQFLLRKKLKETE